ncbi:MAG: HD domain-containing protein, partial [Firmicutes bacterium]|nr:HD domain-containing protein [Bacillota bacterium]
MKNIALVEQYVRQILQGENTGHDYYHSIRVLNNALLIAKGLDVDIDLIKVCCLVHDLIDRKVTSDIVMAKNNLEKCLIEAEYKKEEISKIFHIIENVSYSKGTVPSSLEGLIVQDADRLEALGAIGIARTFAYGGKNNRLIYDPEKKGNDDSIAHFYDKLLKLEELMNTENAKNIARERTIYMK